MAAPPEVNIGDLTGKFTLNKSLSDDLDPVLALQGVGWLTRKAIGLASVYLDVKQYVDEQGMVHIDIVQTASAGLGGTTENRTMDWTERDHEDRIFGKVTGKNRLLSFDSGEIDDDYLKEDWLEEGEGTGPSGELHMQGYVESVNGWTGNQVWGFAMIGDERRYTRRVVVTKGSEVRKIRMIYDYTGK
ncbi:hypothetical protein BP6252_12686 [Coleophoma cylindrospora]|uniref:Uncharacterized protein n=1 Tax=Coleophoma cylindrospora TaxID=1849047 RepID=A0A3D8QCT0_9HELO|nr:hypothetical protein BP6252_12686 [Coleophoma cylindrospora]